MLPPRACELLFFAPGPHFSSTDNYLRPDVFLGLNGVRALSVISMLLVFASSIFVLVHDVQAVNRFMKDNDADLSDCEYIECVFYLSCLRSALICLSIMQRQHCA